MEHYKTPVWNQWDWYPTINLSYMPAPGYVWQLALSSDKDYPDYWAVQDAISYLGGGYTWEPVPETGSGISTSVDTYFEE